MSKLDKHLTNFIDFVEELTDKSITQDELHLLKAYSHYIVQQLEIKERAFFK